MALNTVIPMNLSCRRYGEEASQRCESICFDLFAIVNLTLRNNCGIHPKLTENLKMNSSCFQFSQKRIFKFMPVIGGACSRIISMNVFMYTGA